MKKSHWISLAIAWTSFADGFLQPQPSRLNHHGASRPLWMSTVAFARDGELQPGIDAIDAANPTLYQKLSNLRGDPYFQFYSVDILGSCEYIPQELFECYSETCEIYPVGDEEVPDPIKMVDSAEHDFELDGFARWDMPTDDYYDVAAFPEGYTGYDGREVWEYIHNRICFPVAYSDQHWKADFNRAVSGLHSMISAQVTRGIQERVDAGEPFSDDEVWRDPDAEFARRLGPQGDNPLALENLYFGYMLLLSAAAKAKPILLQGVGSVGSSDALRDILDDPIVSDNSVGVALSKLENHVMMDPTSLWEARMRTRELARIMNCVQCNKCRLHGKISTMGLSTAFQILLGGNISSLRRVEIATFIATLHKFSTAVDFCQRKLMY
ncbi:ERO1-like protein alpha [Seminavis robusta]|uniref:ERO1-like protein alpha n=1 Tax=Seminavis robusta TaxID=568900 RepID=A0A9N8EDQ5_9STRA|nr:ERO1-like protein alpha [Seminavis robusta]|eukprot:Sro1026_g232930.1 ERO1-like protein alpha (382) ;mRNA; f:27764-29000